MVMMMMLMMMMMITIRGLNAGIQVCEAAVLFRTLML